MDSPKKHPVEARESGSDYRVKEAAQVLRIHEKTVYALIAKGALHSYKIGRSRRIRRESVEAIRGTV